MEVGRRGEGKGPELIKILYSRTHPPREWADIYVLQTLMKNDVKKGHHSLRGIMSLKILINFTVFL